MSQPTEKDAFVYERAAADHYVEPAWVVELLADAEPWPERIWDPCCGYGTIPKVFEARGHSVIASDLVDRGYGTAGQNFLKYRRQFVGRVDAIVTNPPFKHTQAFVDQALKLATNKVAVLSPLKWLASRSRKPLFQDRWPLARVHVISNRPSMPPGEYLDPETGLFACDDPNPGKNGLRWKKGDKPSGGAIDYAWFVFEHGHQGPPTLGWVATPGRAVSNAGASKPAPEAAQGRPA